MTDWRNLFSKSSNPEEPEDFILLQKEINTNDTNKAGAFSADEIRRSMEDTGEIPVVSDEMLGESFAEESSSHPVHTADNQKQKRETGLKGFAKAYRKWFLSAGITAAGIVVIWALFFLISVLTDPLRGYEQAEVVKGNVISAMPAEGTLTANARYSITSLVSGKVVESKFEVGDKVSKGSILYKLDDTDAKLTVERAKNELTKSKSAGTTAATSTDKIYSTVSGTVHTVNIRSGGAVSYGQVVCTVKKSDESIIAITSPASGVVSSVNVREGSSVSVNSLIALVNSTQNNTTKANSIYDQKSNELDVKMAENQLENYTIKSPVSGVVVAKNAKVGDNVGITNTENPMMIILDTSSLKFTFLVDEYTLTNLETGLDVIVNTASLPDKSFSGVISRIGSEGTANEEGIAMFEVDVTIDKPGALKSGMKVTAKVILESATNVMYVPHQALMEADGENAVVLVKNPDGMIDTSAGLDTALEYPWISVPKGCRLVRVKYGVGNGSNVEIVSGLKAGDIVIYDPEAELIDLTPAPAEEEFEEEDAIFEKEEEQESDEDTENAEEPSEETSKPKASTKPKGTQSL